MKKRKELFMILVLVVSTFTGCTFPFTTASYKWKIKWDKDKIEAKKEFTSQKLSQHTKGKLPNIIFIVADDLGKFEISAYGSETMNTPYIDKLASEGVRFTDCYVSSPVCGPSRAGLMTGRYQTRFGFETQPMEVYPNNLLVYTIGRYMSNTGDFVMDVKPKFPPEWQMVKQGVPPTEFTLAEILKMRNYNTACVGKWHLGYDKELIPNERGFDYQYGFYGAFSLYSKKRNSPNMVNYKSDSFSYKVQWKTGRTKTSAIRRNNKVIKEDRYLTDAILYEGIDFIARHKDDKDPFFLYLAFNAPHVPFQVPKVYYELESDEPDEKKRIYHAMIQVLDDAIGTLMDKVKRLGLEENTIIYFISDNGGASYTGATDNGPYKGGKLTEFEGGVNVPFIMKWKGHIPEGLVYDKPVSSMDIFMTSVKEAECPLPEDRTFDGVNLIPYLTNEKHGWPHEVFYWKADHIQAMRTKDWKFLMSTRDNWIELYNISEDKYEQFDLYGEKPDTLKNMLRRYDKWKLELQPPLWPRIMDHKFTIDGKEYLFPA
jgi:arylsulfatase A-like enzyme